MRLQLYIRGAFNKFPDFFFVQAFKIVVDSGKFTMLLLYILGDDWTIFRISDSNEQLQQQLEYTLLKRDCHSRWISKMQSGREDTLQERYAIKFCFKLGKNAKETYEILQTAFGASCMNRTSVFEWHKEGKESVRDNERSGGSKEVNTPKLIAKGLGLGLLCWGFKGVQERFRRKRPAVFKSGQWHFLEDNAPVYNSILVTDYLIKMGFKTVSQPPYSRDLAPCDFCLFPKLRGCRYEAIEERNEAVTKVIDTLTQEDFHGGLPEVVGTVEQVHGSRRRLLRRGLEFHVCTINKSVNTKKVWKLI